MKHGIWNAWMAFLLAAALVLPGCGAAAPAEPAERPAPAGEPDAPEKREDARAEEAGERIAVPGPFGSISVVLPEGWEYLPYCADSDQTGAGAYGLWVRPAGTENGYVDIFYEPSFAVCGTGLEQEETVLAGDAARIGTYDGHDMWDFVCFLGMNEGVAALNCQMEERPETERDAARAVLDTLRWEPEKAAGGMFVYRSGAEIPEIGVAADMYRIRADGATVRLRAYDPDLATGKLMYGDDYTLERLEEGTWTEVPVIIEGEWAATGEAYTIPGDPEERSEGEVDWS